MEALSLGLKFATCTPKNIAANIILNNYCNCDTDFSKGFIQGNILASVSQAIDSSLPKRYIQVRSNLTQNPNIISSPANKSGGVVIMNKQRYVHSISSLLEDKNTYEISNLTAINEDIISFNKLLKKKLVKPQKTWTSLIEHHSTIPALYGLPKIDKSKTPLRPIISSIGSVTHKIAGAIAKIQPPFTRHNQPLSRHKLRIFN